MGRDRQDVVHVYATDDGLQRWFFHRYQSSRCRLWHRKHGKETRRIRLVDVRPESKRMRNEVGSTLWLQVRSERQQHAVRSRRTESENPRLDDRRSDHNPIIERPPFPAVQRLGGPVTVLAATPLK